MALYLFIAYLVAALAVSWLAGRALKRRVNLAAGIAAGLALFLVLGGFGAVAIVGHALSNFQFTGINSASK